MDSSFFKGKKVFITGHTGFKGSWLSRMLVDMDADLTGYALPQPTEPALFNLCGLAKEMHSVIGDIRDFDMLKSTFESAQPEIVIHMAAQPIVRDGYRMPRLTYETNVMGTVNLLECVRESCCVKSFLNVTTDKVYLNDERNAGFTEENPLDGFDPYSNSKSCSELVTHAYKNSFFSDGHCAISTARAGNVIGGGDFAADRIVPDCVRAAMQGKPIIVRNPYSTRPYQHVLDPLFVYLMIVQAQYGNIKYAGWYNVGPDDHDCVTTSEFATLFCIKWGQGITWQDISEVGAPHEAGFLKLDSSKLKETFNWLPRINTEKAVEMVVEWTKLWQCGDDINACMREQIKNFFEQQSTLGKTFL